jgi:hypothetical protein
MRGKARGRIDAKAMAGRPAGMVPIVLAIGPVFSTIVSLCLLDGGSIGAAILISPVE